MHLLKSNIIYSNFGDLLSPENNDQFHSLTIIYLMLWIFFNRKIIKILSADVGCVEFLFLYWKH